MQSKLKGVSDPDWKILRDNCPKGLLKSQWYIRLQPATQKFAGIVDKNQPTSEYLCDDPEMDLYWKSMLHLYSKQGMEGLPKKFNLYLQAYFFLSGHSKFASVLESNKKSGIRRKGCKPKMVSDNVTMSTQELSQKQPSYASVNSQQPVGSDSAKK